MASGVEHRPRAGTATVKLAGNSGAEGEPLAHPGPSHLQSGTELQYSWGHCPLWAGVASLWEKEMPGLTSPPQARTWHNSPVADRKGDSAVCGPHGTPKGGVQPLVPMRVCTCP